MRQLECATIMLSKYEVDPNRSCRSTPNAIALHIATQEKMHDMVRLLLERGAHVNRVHPGI